MASRDAVKDSSFSASSTYDNRYLASNGRLNGTIRCWAPSDNNNADDYLQIDLAHEYIICAVATQGNAKVGGFNEWTTKYKIQLSLDGTTFVTYQENNVDKVGIFFITRELVREILYYAHFHVKQNTSSVHVWDYG